MKFLLGFGALALSAHACVAQQPQTKPQPLPANDDGTYTLHIYPTLFQVPTLVLPYNSNFPLTAAFVPADFKISVDDGPEFQPITARREGEDPLDIAILLDASGPENSLLPKFSAALHTAAQSGLHPQDRVSLYAVDCKSAATPQVPADHPQLIDQAVDAALNFPGLHGTHARSACENSVAIWDAVSIITTRFPERPSRRIILLISEGLDGKSKLSFDTTLAAIRRRGISVFGMRDGLVHDSHRAVENRLADVGMLPHGDPVTYLADNSGGKVYDIDSGTIGIALTKLIADLRGRYILEFQAPEDRQPGEHRIAITVTRDRAYTRAAPVTAAIPDPAITSDPTFIHSTAAAPTFGTQKPAKK